MNARTAAQIHTSEAWTLKSENTGQEYRISVSLPASYDHEPEKAYPTVYMVDGDIFYEMVTGAARLMAMSGLIPEVIIVSVGYPLAA